MKASAVGWKGAWVVPVLALAWGVWPVKLAALPPQGPTVTGLSIVSDAGADSTYTLHEQIRVEVEFSDTVVVTGGPPRLTLGVGTATRHADYDSGTMTRKLIFAYRVQPSDTDTTAADGGISVPGPTIALNGGTIQAVGSATPATLTLGSHTITNDREHQVQGTIEEAPKVGAMWISSSPGSDATYQAGDSITVDIRFDKPVDVTPTPQLRLNIGTATRQADYASGTGTTTLRFGYAVGPSDLDLDGISVETGMLTLNGGEIQIQGGTVDASLDLFSHPFPNNPGHKVDGRAGVVGVRIASSPTTNVYRLGERLTIHVVFSTSVRVTGAPRLGLTIGTQRRYARYTSGSGSATLAFSYTVQATDRDTNGFSVPSGWLILDGGTISPPGATLNANLNLQGHVIVNAAGHRVDGSQTLNPVFSASKYEFRLAENVAGPVLLGRVKATDPGGASVRYSLATGDKDRFAVDSLIGGVNYIGKGEDLEQQSSNILLIVRATGQYGQALVDVTVVLTDRNEAPTFPDTTYVFRLAENVRGPVEVGRVEATDPDGDALSYRLVTGGQGLFDVHASTGAVRYVGKGEDYEGTGASRWTLAVEAADTAGLRARTVATVALLDRNEAPTFPDTTYVFELKENVRGPVVVGVVRATDPDGDVLKYRLASGNVARFLVDGRTGRVFYQGTGEDYDAAGPKQWSLVVEAADTAGLRATTVASVVLLNENEVPTFPDTAYAFELNENVSGPVAVGTLRAADPDGDMLTYSMTAGDAGRFDVHATSGVVRYLGRGEDYEAAGPKRWRLTVVATDRSDLTARTTVTVRLADVNEAPAFADTAYAFELIENARGPLTVGRVNATDPDRGDLPRYSLASGDAGRFQVNATNGVVRYVGTGEDYEGAGPKRWVLTLEATDRGGLKTRAKATVVLSNRNEAPVFADTAYAFDLEENARGQVTVGQVRAVDPDQGDVPRYGLTTGGGGRFEVDAVSGVVRYVGKGEDYEAAGPKRWTLTVVATDRSDLTARTTVTVRLADVNEAPAFADTAYAFELIENARGPLTVGRVNATDPDRGDLPRYSLASGDAGRFQVNATNGVVRYVGTGEDYEGAGPKRWVLTLEATDRGGLKTRAKATVVLSNRNEAPVFADTAYAFDLEENARGQVTVGQVRAVDPDQGDVPRYGLTTGGGGRFEVDAVSGVVRYVGKGEDYEAAGPKWWTLLVEAADPTGLKGWTRVTVTLVDVNEAPEAVGSIAPKTLEAYGATVEEDLRPYFSDPEGDPLRYVAASSAPNVALVTVAASGRLSIIPQAVGVARATITATDPDGLKAEQQVQVTVETARAERSRALTLALAAFGRSLGAETVDAIGGRLGAESSGTLGRSHLQLGGRSVGCGAFAGGRDACDLESLLHGGGALLGLQLSHPEAGRQDPRSRSRAGHRPTLDLVSRDDLLSRSSFQLSFGGGRANPDAASSAAAVAQSAPGTYSRWTLWGQAGAGGFEGRPDSTFTQEGRTNSAYAGVDYRFPSGLLLGLAGSYSVMESDFTSGINGEGSVTPA